MFFKKSNPRNRPDSAPLSTQLAIAYNDLKNAPKEEGSLLIAFIPATLLFKEVVNIIESQFSHIPTRLVMQTAGQIGGSKGDFYHLNSEPILITIFNERLFKQVEAFMVDTLCEDIQKAQVRMDLETRKNKIKATIEQKVRPLMAVSLLDTFILTYFPGLTASENFFLEALVKSNIPLSNLVGGSAGGKLDFKESYLALNGRVSAQEAVLIYCKLNQGYHYEVFTTHNFEKTPTSFLIGEYVPELRQVKSFLMGNELVSAVDALCAHFKCNPENLANALVGYTFAVEILGQIFIRSIGTFNADKSITFFCDLYFGESLILVKATNFIQSTLKAYQEFIRGREAVAILANDCALRRINNQKDLPGFSVFDNCPISGFSSFGEISNNLHQNQTLVALCIFKGEPSKEGNKEFLIHYRNTLAYYEQIKHNYLERVISIKIPY
nr:FIST N-terminal domain-containing protein [Helicobacter suis]